MSNEPDRDKRERLERDAAAAARRAPEPGLPRGGRDRPRGRSRSSGRAELLRALQALRLPARRARRRVPGGARRDREALGARGRPRSSASRLGIGLSDARPWDVARLFRAPELDQLYPHDRMLPALEATLTDLGIDLRSQSNVHLDLESRPSQDAARVLRADRGAGQGDARDPADRRQGRLGGALPRGGPHRALRTRERRRCRSRRAGSATWRSPKAGRC